MLRLIAIVAIACAACGREYPAQPECFAVITDTIYVEPGHRIGGFVIESRCGDFRLHSRQNAAAEGRTVELRPTFQGVGMTGRNAQAQTVDGELMDGGTVRDRALYFKGENIGDWLIGQIATFTQRKFDGNANASDVAVFTPAAVFDAVTGEWKFCREAQLVLGAALSQRLSPRTDRGKIFAVRFDGTEPSQKGNDARLYTVVEQSASKLGSILQKATA